MKAPERGGYFRRSLMLTLLLGLAAALAAPRAHASAAVLVEQPYGQLGHFDPGGHSAIYFDHICAETPVKLRPCRPGELGVVLARYNDIGGYDWLAVPLLPYLYAVDTTAEIPETMDRERLTALRDSYRREHLQSVAPDLPGGKTPGGNWYELIGSSYDRAIYGFEVKTTAEQDAALIAMMNDRKNVERYNGAFVNCADFVRVTINRFYPHAVRRNLIADFGVTSPKAVARYLTHYAKKHPDVDLRVFRIPQVPGSLPRSHSAEGVSESLVRRYGVPLVVLSPITTGLLAIAYIGQGRFEMPKNPPLFDIAALERQANIDAMNALPDPPDSFTERRVLTMQSAVPELPAPTAPVVEVEERSVFAPGSVQSEPAEMFFLP